jgi:hypothetical protein
MPVWENAEEVMKESIARHDWPRGKQGKAGGKVGEAN